MRQKGPIEKEDPNAVRKKLSPKAKEQIMKKTEDSGKGMNKHGFLERFSIECHKSKAKVIVLGPLANHKERRQSREPVKTKSQHA